MDVREGIYKPILLENALASKEIKNQKFASVAYLTKTEYI